jgi:hypothetical protein
MAPTGATGVLDRLLAAGAAPAAAWLAEACAGAGSEQALFLAFALAPRRLGRARAAMSGAERAAAESAVPGWQPWRWTLDQAARARLLLAIPERGPGPLVATLDRLFSCAGLEELVALYQALALLPHGRSHAARAAEGIRSSMDLVFAAVAIDNPYPQAHLDEPAWNQMVVKCLFNTCPLERVVGLDLRANQRLMRMLCGYAHERWAAHRLVDPAVWRLVGRFADREALGDLARVLADGGERERAAAALALSEHASAEARALLATAPPLAAAAASGQLTWAGIAAQAEQGR